MFRGNLNILALEHMSRKTDPEHKRFSGQASGTTVTITETKTDISEKSILNLARVRAERVLVNILIIHRADEGRQMACV